MYIIYINFFIIKLYLESLNYAKFKLQSLVEMFCFLESTKHIAEHLTYTKTNGSFYSFHLL